MPLNAMALIYCTFHIAQIIIIEDIDNIIKGALEVISSVHIKYLTRNVFKKDKRRRI